MPGVFPGGESGRCVRLTTLPPSCAVITKFVNINFLEPSGPLQACNGTVFWDWKTLWIDEINSQFSQVNFHQIYLLYFINTGSTCAYSFFFLEVYVDILSGGKSLVTAHTWIMIYVLLGCHIVFFVQHLLKFVNIAGAHGVVMNYVFFSAPLHCCQMFLPYISYFSVGLLKFVIYFADAIYSYFDFV